MASIIKGVLRFISTIEYKITNIRGFQFFPENLAPAIAYSPSSNLTQSESSFYGSLHELLKDSFLWAVPKKRRTIEKRRARRFGCEKYGYKIHLPKTNILICNKCGSYHEAGLLCPVCYQKVMAETKEMQEEIEAQLGIDPVEKDVVVLYEGEAKDSEFYKGKRIIEMKKERPKIFSNNLMQRSTQPPSNTKEIIKSDELS